MIWLEGLANIQLGRVVEFLEPIASGNNAESRHFRVLAAWASLSTAPLRPDVVSSFINIDININILYKYKKLLNIIFILFCITDISCLLPNFNK